MSSVLLQTAGLVFAGILAGEEVIVRYGVQPALRTLDDVAHIGARVALVRRLRVVVPVLIGLAVLSAVAVLIAGNVGEGSPWRWLGAAALVVFLLFSFLGTVPINSKVIDWRADAPPADWRATVRRWEHLDVYRSSAAVLAFVAFATALAVQLP